MRKECYLVPPPLVETYKVKTGTDIILRRNVEMVKKEDTQQGEYTCYECEEVQYRYPGNLIQEDVENRFEYWWDIAEGKSEIEALDKEAVNENKPTITERLDVLEGALIEFAEVMCNG